MERVEHMVDVDGGEVWAEEIGAGGGVAGGEVPLVLLHAAVGDSRLWDPVLPGLDGRYRVIRYDARGYGRSPKPGATYTQVGDLRAVLEHFGVRRAVVVGTSAGGATAISFALEEPERVAALGLLVPGVRGGEGLESPELLEEIGRLAMAQDMDGLVQLSLRVWGAAGVAPDALAAEALRSAIPAWFTTYGHDIPDPPVFERLGELGMPCTLLLGEKDQPEVVRFNEAVADRIPGCRLVRHPGCDHFPTLRAPDDIARLIVELYAEAG
ncbi:alpha/beta fold hydrolase [Streptomyces graminofaciens]|nr:alpha/beta fold hydrolase [Streptomyces graminofaciens]